MNYKQIARRIAESRKVTPCRVYIRGRFEETDFAGAGFQAFGEGSAGGGRASMTALSKRRPDTRRCLCWTCAR
jgi:hypothetical protein